ncbi:hypothetical protein C8R47DRAFT_1194299 [Mycena vitilis]|nr:hypothetical protein C8R47DRAFT_1194299 [Mycena vitilis]
MFLQTMEKVSEEFLSFIVPEGGLAAPLNYLDFLSIAVQRTALQAASNGCRNVSPDHSGVIRIIDSSHRALVNTDLIRAVNQLLNLDVAPAYAFQTLPDPPSQQTVNYSWISNITPPYAEFEASFAFSPLSRGLECAAGGVQGVGFG